MYNYSNSVYSTYNNSYEFTPRGYTPWPGGPDNPLIPAGFGKNKPDLGELVTFYPAPVNSIRGTYRGYFNYENRFANTFSMYELVLRIDVEDRVRLDPIKSPQNPLNIVSGDIFNSIVSQPNRSPLQSYVGSFIANGQLINTNFQDLTNDTRQFVFEIRANIFNTNLPNNLFFRFPSELYVTIERTFTPDDNKDAQLYSIINDRINTNFNITCKYVSPYFRDLEVENDFERGVSSFNVFNGDNLSYSRLGRYKSYYDKYGFPLIRFETSLSLDGVDISRIPGNEINNPVALNGWNDRELHNAMLNHFSKLENNPQWNIWLFEAKKHEQIPNSLGVMFDLSRKGCAVFDQTIIDENLLQKYGLNDPSIIKLYAIYHELGHCFNLDHTRSNSTSWMNIPESFHTGERNYWDQFRFEFDPEELLQIRHGFLNNIIMGADNIFTGVPIHANDYNNINFQIETQDIKIKSKENFILGEPVFIEIKLKTTKHKKTHIELQPNCGSVKFIIKKPSDRMLFYRPIIKHMVIPKTVKPDTDSYEYDVAYIGFGRDGFYFKEYGIYYIQALYTSLEGNIIASNILPIIIQNSDNQHDREISSKLIGQEQGLLFCLQGSDSTFLAKGNTKLDQIIQNYPDNPLSIYPKLIKGLNLCTAFKVVNQDSSVSIREQQNEEGIQCLLEVIEKFGNNNIGLDNITLKNTCKFLIMQYKTLNKNEEIVKLNDRILKIFENRINNKQILETIKKQIS